MKNRDRYLPALLALTQQSKELHSSEVTDVGKMSFEQFWQDSNTPKLTGHSAVLFSSDLEKTAELLERCPVIPNGCLIISQQMCKDADALCRLFPLGLVEHPTPGGVFRWDHRKPGMNLKVILENTQNFYTVVYMSGLQLSSDILKELYSHHNNGVLLISENLRQEMVGNTSDIPSLFAADYLIIHGASDTDTISAHLPSTKVSQPQNNLVVNFHNPSMPMQVGNGTPLISRGNDCGKPHKLSLSVSQSFSLVEKPLFDASELRQKRKDGVTVVLNQQSCDYYAVTLRESVLTLSDRLHAFFDSTAGLPMGP